MFLVSDLFSIRHIFSPFTLDGENPLLVSATNRDEKKQLEDFYQPRTVLLTLASEFTLQCTERYSQLKSNTRGQNDTKFSDIIDEENAFVRSHPYLIHDLN